MLRRARQAWSSSVSSPSVEGMCCGCHAADVGRCRAARLIIRAKNLRVCANPPEPPAEVRQAPTLSWAIAPQKFPRRLFLGHLRGRFYRLRRPCRDSPRGITFFWRRQPGWGRRAIAARATAQPADRPAQSRPAILASGSSPPQDRVDVGQSASPTQPGNRCLLQWIERRLVAKLERIVAAKAMATPISTPQ